MPGTDAPDTPARNRAGIGVRWLAPETTEIFEGTFSLLHCSVKGGELYRGVYAVRMFPIRRPGRFIALRCFTPEGGDVEIGVIDKLSDFPKGQRKLIRDSLTKYYHEQIVTRVHRVESEYGLLFFDVETQRGREQFVMPYQTERAEDYGETGKVLLESLGNRYIIPDVSALPPADRRRFTAFVYW